MAVNLYTGLMGAGKSMELTRSIILPALKSGRRVVTNLDGLNYELICAYLVKNDADAEKIGKLIIVKSMDFVSPSFFPQSEESTFKFPLPSWLSPRALKIWADFYTETHARAFNKRSFDIISPHLVKLHDAGIDTTSCLIHASNVVSKRAFSADAYINREPGLSFETLPALPDSIVKGGDLIVIDEAWKFLAKKSEVPDEFIDFLRMHRHYADEITGQTCDLALAAQHIDDLKPMILDVVEFHYRMKKFKAIGKPTSYRVDVFEGSTDYMSRRISYSINSYDKEIFPLYKSYANGSGKEGTIDGRSTAVSRFKIIGISGALLFLLFFTGYNGYRSYLKYSEAKKPKASPVSTIKNQYQVQAQTNSNENLSSMTLLGTFTSKGVAYIIVQTDGKLRLEPRDLMIGSNPITGIAKIDGKVVTSYSGSNKSSNIMKQ